MELGKIPPHDIEAEQAILGSMLTDKDAVMAAMEVLREEDFYRDDNKAIFDAMMSLYSRSEPIDIITVKSELISNGKFEQVGGLEYLVMLPEKVPTTTNVDKYIKIVEEKSLLRNLIKTANDIIAVGYDQTEDVEDIMNVAEKKIFDVMQRKSQKGYNSIKDVLVGTFAELEKLYNQKGALSGIPTGFSDLDYKTSGLHNSDLIIVAARPAMGKSAFAINIATNVAVQSNVPVIVFNLEMSKEQVANRIICSEAMVDSNKIRTGKIEDEDWIKLANASGKLAEAPIYIDDTPGISIMEIRAKCRKMKLEKNIGLVVIDYLQFIKPQEKSGNRFQDVGEIARGLKSMARELNIPVIALCQLNRQLDNEDREPTLADLRESGEIENNADIVMFLNRKSGRAEEVKDIDLIIGKFRNGALRTIRMTYKGDCFKFAEKEKAPKQKVEQIELEPIEDDGLPF